MIHPEERPAAELAAGRRGSVLMAVLLFVAIVVVAAFGYVKSQGTELKNIDVRQFFSGNNKVEQLNDDSNIIEIPYDAKEHPVFGVHMDYIVKCNRDGIWLLDRKGHELWSVGIPLSNPIIKTNGKNLLVADIGGKDIYVINGKSVRWNDRTEESIQNAEINENGYVTVITSSRLYNGEVRVYDDRGIELLQSVIANNFAVTAKIAPSGKMMVIDLINASDAKAYTYLKFSDMNGKDLIEKSMPQDKGIYPFVWFSKDDAVVAAGDTSIVFMDNAGNIKSDKQFSKVASASITGSKRVAAAVVNGNAGELKVFSADGREYSSAPLRDEVLSISAFEGVIAVNTGRKASFWTERCKSKGEYNSKSDIIEVFFFSSHQAAIVTKTNIAVVDIG